MGQKSGFIRRVLPADLSPAQIDAVRQMEASFEQGICLLAVKQQVLFVLEAKTAPGRWQAIQDVYSQDDLPSWYGTREEALAAKAVLKGLLNGKWQPWFKKYPIRVRQVDDSFTDHEQMERG
jgi:hypothetical protein